MVGEKKKRKHGDASIPRADVREKAVGSCVERGDTDVCPFPRKPCLYTHTDSLLYTNAGTVISSIHIFFPSRHLFTQIRAVLI